MTYNSGICVPWITANDLDCDLPDPDTGGIVALSVAAAVEVMFALSGSQFPGTCTTTVRPTACGCFCRCGSSRSAYPGRWSNVSDAIELGFDPIKGVSSVVIDGVPLDSTAYRVEEEQWLVRQDGNLWPCQQRRDLATTEYGTWTLDVEHGEDPPSMGIIAAKTFACELIKAQVPALAGKCALPKRTQTITRAGLSIVVKDPFEFLDQRRTGVYEIDTFLQTYNPEDLEGNFAIGIPTDLPTAIRTTS